MTIKRYVIGDLKALIVLSERAKDMTSEYSPGGVREVNGCNPRLKLDNVMPFMFVEALSVTDPLHYPLVRLIELVRYLFSLQQGQV